MKTALITGITGQDGSFLTGITSSSTMSALPVNPIYYSKV